MNTTSSRLLPLAAIAVLYAKGADIPKLRPFEAVEAHMGTLFRIKLFAQDEEQANRGFRAAFERIAELDAALSDYLSDSELSRVTKGPIHQPVPVSHDLFLVLSASQNIAEKTDGAFDVTLGPLTRLWRAARKQGVPPNPAALTEATSRCGFRYLHLDTAAETATFAIENMQLDAGGIAKGYAADEALARLRLAGISRALVAASGDLAFGDPPPGERGWKIGVDTLDSASEPFTQVLLLANAAVSTSGDTEQHLDAADKRYSHILDPKTGVGLTNQVSVTVIAPHGIFADAASTAISVLGPVKGLAFAKLYPDMTVFINP